MMLKGRASHLRLKGRFTTQILPHNFEGQPINLFGTLHRKTKSTHT